MVLTNDEKQSEMTCMCLKSATYESSAVTTLQPSSHMKQSGEPVQVKCFHATTQNMFEKSRECTRCDHRLYCKRNARLHSETVAGRDVEHVRVHVHVRADTVASKALHNLLAQNNVSPCNVNQVSIHVADPKSILFGPSCYDLPNDFKRNTRSTRCQKCYGESYTRG